MEPSSSLNDDEATFLEQKLFADEQLSTRSDYSDDDDNDEEEDDDDDEEDDDDEDDDEDEEVNDNVNEDNQFINCHKNILDHDIVYGEESAIDTFQEVLNSEPTDRCSDISDSGFSSEIADNNSNDAIKKCIKPTSSTVSVVSAISYTTATSDLQRSESNREMCIFDETTALNQSSESTNVLNNEGYDFVSKLLADHTFVPKLQKSNLKRSHPDDGYSLLPVSSKRKRSIQFDNVTVYYFPRVQGFTCIPSQGGSTLGMSSKHVHVKRYTLTEHAIEQKRLHKLAQNDYRTDNEEFGSDLSENDNDSENGSCYYLQPVPLKDRRMLLRTAGLKNIDRTESIICRKIRRSREVCGCSCKTYCDPDSCSCSQAGIKCQVDRMNFPCGCIRDNCANSNGRIEFNPFRVKTHFIHTLMRLELEKNAQQHQQSSMNLIPSWNSNTPNMSTTSLASTNSSNFVNNHTNNCNINFVQQDSNQLDFYSETSDSECYPPISNNIFSFMNNTSCSYSNSQQSVNNFYQNSTMTDFQSSTFSSFCCEPESVYNQNQGNNFQSILFNQNNEFECYTNSNYLSPHPQSSDQIETENNAELQNNSNNTYNNNSTTTDKTNIGNNDLQLSTDFLTANFNDFDDENFGEIIKKTMVETVSA